LGGGGEGKLAGERFPQIVEQVQFFVGSKQFAGEAVNFFSGGGSCVCWWH